MICNKCNRNLTDDSKFCPYCGNKIEKSEPVENSDVVEHEILVDSESDISKITLDDILKIQAKATIEAMKANAETQPENEGDEDFGLVPEKPIFTLALKSVDGEEEYFNKLRTTNGEIIRYNRRGSTSVAGINGMIDIYDTYLLSGEFYKTIYINMYGAEASTSAPNGFMFSTSVFTPISSKESKHSTEIPTSKKHKQKASAVFTKFCSFLSAYKKAILIFTIASFALFIVLLIPYNVLATYTDNLYNHYSETCEYSSELDCTFYGCGLYSCQYCKGQIIIYVDKGNQYFIPVVHFCVLQNIEYYMGHILVVFCLLAIIGTTAFITTVVYQRKRTIDAVNLNDNINRQAK